MRIYAIRDTNRNVVKSIFAQYSDDFAVSAIKQMLAELPSKLPCQDDELLCIGEYDDNTGGIVATGLRMLTVLEPIWKEVHRDEALCDS